MDLADPAAIGDPIDPELGQPAFLDERDARLTGRHRNQQPIGRIDHAQTSLLGHRNPAPRNNDAVSNNGSPTILE